MSSERVPAFDASLGLAMGKGEPATVPADSLKYVTDRILDSHGGSLQHNQDAAMVAALFSRRAIRPDEIAALRRRMFDLVGTSLGEVELVMMGKKNWSPTQARLFALLTERVMPKLSSITVQDDTSRKLDELSIEELEIIALGKRKAHAVDAVVMQGQAHEEVAEKRERTEAKRDVIRGLALQGGIEEAEKRFIARQVGAPMAEHEAETAARSVKAQPKPSADSLGNLRKARSGCIRDNWREQGLPEEEVQRRWQERLDKIAATKQRTKEIRLMRQSQGMGLDADGLEAAKAIRNFKNKTLKEFRVHGLKGTKSMTSLAKEAASRAEKAEKRKEKAENPRIFGTQEIPGVSAEQRKKLRLRELRELRPDLFKEGDE